MEWLILGRNQHLEVEVSMRPTSSTLTVIFRSDELTIAFVEGSRERGLRVVTH